MVHRYDAAMLRKASARVVLSFVLGATSTASLSPTAMAQPVEEQHRNQVVLSGYVIVPRGRTVSEVVVFQGGATVLGVVEGDVIVLDGPATVAGQVGGDVVVLDGRAVVRDTAQITGNVLSGYPVEVEEGARIGGEIREGFSVTLEGPIGAFGALLVPSAMAVSTLILMALVALLAPRGVERLGIATRTAPLASAGWGLVVAILVPIVGVVLVASVLGFPLGLATLLALGLVFLIGLGCAALGVGRMLLPPPRSRAGAMFAGWGILAVVGLVPVVNGAVWGIAAVFGLGLLIVAAWRARGVSKHRIGAASPSAETPAFPERGSGRPVS
jgi:hypothetical protein